MGLCKCPKRRVTNQFCFEHRVNVCEHCMVTNHPKCVVQSYLQWLQDSDYNPICELCTKPLADEDCVRLICFHVYHWSCLDHYARQLPPTTAPAGYVCPSCGTGLFPASNLVSPVADVLKEKLAGVNWARAGLGLPLLSDDRELKPTSSQKITLNGLDSSEIDSPLNSNQRQNTPKHGMIFNSVGNHIHSDDDSNPHSVVNVDDSLSTFSRADNFSVPGQVPRKVFEALDDPKDMSFDHDENKYKRRSAMEWFSRWWKSISGPKHQNRRSSGHLYRRYWMAAIIILIVLVTVIAIFSWLGRIATANDPIFDPHQNPNVRVDGGRES